MKIIQKSDLLNSLLYWYIKIKTGGGGRNSSRVNHMPHFLAEWKLNLNLAPKNQNKDQTSTEVDTISQKKNLQLYFKEQEIPRNNYIQQKNGKKKIEKHYKL